MKVRGSAASTAAPIGVFDSGLGGLTVVRQLQIALPDERIIYVADQAHVPYGGRDLKEVCGFACGISQALLYYGCKAVVMACNISSATGLPHVQAEHRGVPVLGVIEPGAKTAASQTRNRRVGVLATEGTVRSGAYTRTLRALDPALHVIEIACPDFVPLVESEQEDTPAALDAAHRYLSPLQQADVDTVVLGCTHYPFLLSQLQRVAPDVTFIDPAIAASLELRKLLSTQSLCADERILPHLLTTTGDPAAFAHQLTRFLPNTDAAIAVAYWHNGTLEINHPLR
jgi:glutamate racemase